MNKLEVGKSYTLYDGKIIRVEEYREYEKPEFDVDHLYYICSDAMWRNEDGVAFPDDPETYKRYSVDWSKLK